MRSENSFLKQTEKDLMRSAGSPQKRDYRAESIPPLRRLPPARRIQDADAPPFEELLISPLTAALASTPAASA
jgi:hypothetical protein